MFLSRLRRFFKNTRRKKRQQEWDKPKKERKNQQQRTQKEQHDEQLRKVRSEEERSQGRDTEHPHDDHNLQPHHGNREENRRGYDLKQERTFVEKDRLEKLKERPEGNSEHREVFKDKKPGLDIERQKKTHVERELERRQKPPHDREIER